MDKTNKLLQSVKIDKKEVEKLAKDLTKKDKIEQKEKIIKISVNLPESLHKALKIYCIENNVNIQDTGLKLFKELLKIK